MTLVVTVATARHVIQASDRRITKSTPAGGHIPGPCDALKSVVAGSRDAYFVVACIGLGSLGGQPVDEWVDDWFQEAYSDSHDLPYLIDLLRIRLEDEVRVHYLPTEQRQLTLVFGGFRQGGIPFVVSLSNFEDDKGCPGPVQYGFRSDWFLPRDGTNADKCCFVGINGVERTVSESMLRDLDARREEQFFQQSDSRVVSDWVATFIRKASQRPLYGQYISKGCVVTTIPFDDRECIMQAYYEEDARVSLWQILPGGGIRCFEDGSAKMKDVYVWHGDGDPPWWTGHARHPVRGWRRRQR